MFTSFYTHFTRYDPLHHYMYNTLPLHEGPWTEAWLRASLCIWLIICLTIIIILFAAMLFIKLTIYGDCSKQFVGNGTLFLWSTLLLCLSLLILTTWWWNQFKIKSVGFSPARQNMHVVIRMANNLKTAKLKSCLKPDDFWKWKLATLTEAIHKE